MKHVECILAEHLLFLIPRAVTRSVPFVDSTGKGQWDSLRYPCRFRKWQLVMQLTATLERKLFRYA